ncbi:MAG: hypothetical protein B7Z78_01080 [Rhodospirillales bacterium 20-60-12]|nr:MAG: hypothetical protein B7Z78_01080 [Rhodospirillales bacterium 20-60-12]HQT66157.1 hypothetical protein [Acetobacteraceae bacterium]
MQKYALAALAGCAIMFTCAQARASSIQYQDIYISYRTLWQDQQPGTNNGHPTTENALNFSYANGWTYGSNFASFDLEQFGKGDPSNNALGANSDTGSAEFYGLVRSTLSGNKITGTKDFAFGPIADIGLRIGGDYDTQNDAFGSYKRYVVIGPQFDIAVPAGYWNISLEATHEWDTDGFYPKGGSNNFDVAPSIETAWMIPFKIAGVPMQFTGYANIIGPKGKGNYQDFYHHTEILAHPKILVDVGSIVGYEPGHIMAGVGYEYWYNKFGTYKPYVDGAQQHAVFFEVGYNFN